MDYFPCRKLATREISTKFLENFADYSDSDDYGSIAENDGFVEAIPARFTPRGPHANHETPLP
ncbi:hypothetical protein THTE_2501 [Thermogutta terrifontis]|mgnify:CR=1 FL=1|jgi:hypothetical protein|uniref:Uncharacterized protein n=1 Tax=Thermogutta terrifontis TaxID=1331910 RepID=A0A286RGM3_9BACT|nr:hypothetical protein THTE_2501 [Thermogutta terrifontis]